MDGFEVDIEAMWEAHRNLEELRGRLAGQRGMVEELLDSVRRSQAPIHDPVADKLHEVYRGRANAEEGVHALLDEYLEELDDIRLVIETTLRNYDEKDTGASEGIQAVAREVR